jgi:hypothetical protein
MIRGAVPPSSAPDFRTSIFGRAERALADAPDAAAFEPRHSSRAILLAGYPADVFDDLLRRRFVASVFCLTFASVKNQDGPESDLSRSTRVCLIMADAGQPVVA